MTIPAHCTLSHPVRKSRRRSPIPSTASLPQSSLLLFALPILASPHHPPFTEGEHTEPPRRLESLGGGHEWNRSGLPFHGLRRHALVLLLVCPLLYILPHRIHTLDLPLASGRHWARRSGWGSRGMTLRPVPAVVAHDAKMSSTGACGSKGGNGGGDEEEEPRAAEPVAAGSPRCCCLPTGAESSMRSRATGLEGGKMQRWTAMTDHPVMLPSPWP
ncbi:unnamed protein product [Urochloa humidicola]